MPIPAIRYLTHATTTKLGCWDPSRKHTCEICLAKPYVGSQSSPLLWKCEERGCGYYNKYRAEDGNEEGGSGCRKCGKKVKAEEMARGEYMLTVVEYVYLNRAGERVAGLG